MNFFIRKLNKLKGFFTKEKISVKGWSIILFIYFGLILFRCLLVDYAETFEKKHIINATEMLNKEPTIFYVPFSLILMALSIAYILTRISSTEKLFFFSIIATTILSISRLIIDYSYLTLLIINHSLILLLLLSFIILRASVKGDK